MRFRGFKVRRAIFAALALAVSAAGLPATSEGAPPPLLRHFCESGSGAGQCLNPLGLAVDPASGNLYVSNSANRRVEEFTAYGAFVKAWGWGVVDGSPELQTCT